MINIDKLYELSQTAVLVDFSPGYRLGDFTCTDEDYAVWLQNDAEYYISQRISHVQLLINRSNADIIGYMAFCSDSFKISDEEKHSCNLDISFSNVPALKIGKLAINKKYEHQYYGSFMIYLAIGITNKINENGVACRFLTVDADITTNKTIPDFYLENGFIFNEKMNKGRTENVSMRYDLYGG